jgi:urease subunit gamma
VHLTKNDQDKLMTFLAAQLAERRLERGLKLNYPETVAYLSFAVMEGARDGRSVAELMSEGLMLLSRDQVMEGVP